MASTPQDYLKSSLTYVVEPVINAIDTDWLRAIVEMGAEIDVKNDYIGEIVNMCSKAYFFVQHNNQLLPDHRKYIRMIDYLLDVGCKLPPKIKKQNFWGSIKHARHGLILVVEFLFKVTL